MSADTLIGVGFNKFHLKIVEEDIGYSGIKVDD